MAENREFNIDGVPLPADAAPLSSGNSAFGGTWIGTWDNVLKTILIVESAAPDGSAKVIYAIAENPGVFKSAWSRYDGKISGDTLQVSGRNAVFTFTLSSTGRLRGVFGDGNGFAVLEKRPLESVTEADVEILWLIGESEFLETDLTEGGKPVRLEAVMFRPIGQGPFPLAVVNHGSTGSGSDEAAAKWTWVNTWLANYLNERGWIVAFPQRRGRGKSDGLYDEGFGEDRAQGYTCEKDISLAGANRALEDVRAAIIALRSRDEVTDDPILLAGQSRGGALSVAYSGRYPDETHGVINFVGGWMGDLCDSAVAINQTLMNGGADFKDETLWLYGKDDPFYSSDHNTENFEAFRDAGGSGRFLEFSLAGSGNGHWVISVPPLWAEPVSNYLKTIGKAGKDN